MSTLIKRIVWYGNKGTDTGVDLEDINSISIKRGLDAKSNSIELVLKNPIDQYNGTNIVHKYIDPNYYTLLIKAGDIIEFYLKNADQKYTIDINTTTDLIVTADVVDFEFDLDQKKSTIKLVCIDKTFSLLNKLWTQNYTSTSAMNAPEIIKNIVRNVSGTAESTAKWGYETSDAGNAGTLLTDGTGIFEIDARLESAGGYVQDVRPDASAYPDISMSKLFKPVYEWIEELSQPENTNSAAEITAATEKCTLKHVYFIDKENRLHWFYPDNTSDYTIVTGNNSADGVVKRVKLTRNTFDVVNYVIFNAGKDLNNVSVLNYFYDVSSKEPKLKPKFIPYTYICTNMRQAEKDKGNISINADETVNILVSSGTTAWGESYSSASDYKDKFWNRAVKMGQASARNYIIRRGSPRYKGTVEIVGRNLIPGEVITFTALAIGVNVQKLRIMSAQHIIDDRGWTTSLELEEDEGLRA